MEANGKQDRILRMIKWTATIKKFDKQGEKTGWTYIDVPGDLADKLEPGNKKGFRVKGKLDEYSFKLLALIPMGGGDFILPLNAAIRKAIKKQKGATVKILMEADHNQIQPPVELIDCLKDEPDAYAYYKSLPQGHQNYFTKWIESARTEPTKAKRIAATVNAMVYRWDYGQMIRSMQNQKIV
jgi:hypothetical protein